MEMTGHSALESRFAAARSKPRKPQASGPESEAEEALMATVNNGRQLPRRRCPVFT
jgi:hypothetical protein